MKSYHHEKHKIKLWILYFHASGNIFFILCGFITRSLTLDFIFVAKITLDGG